MVGRCGDTLYSIDVLQSRSKNMLQRVAEYILDYEQVHGRVPTITATAETLCQEFPHTTKVAFEILKSQGYIFAPRNRAGNALNMHMMKDREGLIKYAEKLARR